MKKEQFKNLVLKQIRRLAKGYLISQRGSKTEILMHTHTGSNKDYLTSQQMSTDEKKILFTVREKNVSM